MVRKIMQASFDKLQALAKHKLEHAKEKGLAVEVIIVVGGLCGSPSFQKALENIFSKWESIRHRPISVIFFDKAQSAIVEGAIRVALVGGVELKPFNNRADA
ncbi:hypothetical protein H2200_013638 [Cladophialophora chaetospira]|uniref:Uncharacterized protein n=1 Tax=Cladophialophora chaetospira TaxID=386627 RepID=A0AA38TX38_9EURO|nr:hypothetical protein H2200_013638 [Cladophialophora chaetospira]